MFDEPMPGGVIHLGHIPGLKRRVVLALRRVSSYAFSALIARYSSIGNASVLAVDKFPWVYSFEYNWRLIQRDADTVPCFKGLNSPSVGISINHLRMCGANEKSYFLWAYGYRIHDNCCRCPDTSALLDWVPGLQTAAFSVLEPGAHRPPYCGPTKAIITAHLGLRVPRERDLCWMSLNDQKLHWREGEALIFDDTYRHELRNLTDEARVILLLHVKRPARCLGFLASELFLWCMRKGAFITGTPKESERRIGLQRGAGALKK